MVDGDDGSEAPITILEAHLDLVLAEELAVNPAFLARFIAPGWNRRFYEEPPSDLKVTVSLNVYDGGGATCTSDDAGENDIDVTVTASDGRCLRVLVEDKVGAGFQPDQGRRYRSRADSRGDEAVLVARAGRLHGPDQEFFHTKHAIEELAEWLREQAKEEPASARRLEWRAALLLRLAAPAHGMIKPDHPPTVAFARYCVDWLAARDTDVVADAESLRTAGSGWLYFTEPSGLVYKVFHGRVDLYVGDLGYTGTPEKLAEEVARGWRPEGFHATKDTKGNPVLRAENPSWKWVTSNGVPPDTSIIDAALEATAVAAHWVRSQGTGFDLPTGT